MKPVLYGLLLVVACVQFVRVALPPGNADLISVHSLAYDLAHHEDRFLYPGKGFADNDAWVAHHEKNLPQFGLLHMEPNWCFYPPLIPFLLAPVASVSGETWRMAWGVVQLLLVPLFAELIIFLLRRSGAILAPARLPVYVLVIGSYPVARSLELGQTSLFIAVLLWAGVLARLSGKRVLSALAAGSAIFVKPFLALTEIVPLVKRRNCIALAGIGFATLLLVGSVVMVGVRAHVEYWNLLTTLSSSQTAYSGNQSLFAGLLRLFTTMPATDYGFQYDPGVAILGKLLAVLILGIAAYAQWKSAGADVVASTGLWISAALLALPISWEHHLLFLLPAVAFLWTAREPAALPVALAASTLLLSVDFAPLVSENFFGRFAGSLPLVGNLILFSLLVHLHTGSRAAIPAEA